LFVLCLHQMHFPSNPLQPGPMYFLTPRKFGLFRVSCEGPQKQVNWRVVENSSPESRLNIPQLVGLEDGTVLVNTFDWQAHLSPYFRKPPQIKSYQHFRYLLCRLPQFLGLTATQSLLAFSCCVTQKFYPLSSVFLPCLHLDWPWTGRLIFIQRSGLSVPMKRRSLHAQHHKAQHRMAHRRG
ncbi:hypothetical protein GOODEAATRI_032527, partial [Goodea atripinnis]